MRFISGSRQCLTQFSSPTRLFSSPCSLLASEKNQTQSYQKIQALFLTFSSGGPHHRPLNVRRSLRSGGRYRGYSGHKCWSQNYQHPAGPILTSWNCLRSWSCSFENCWFGSLLLHNWSCRCSQLGMDRPFFPQLGSSIARFWPGAEQMIPCQSLQSHCYWCLAWKIPQIIQTLRRDRCWWQCTCWF